jgi:L-amino acid N-acyltransferase YncA
MLEIRLMKPGDWLAVEAIYAKGIATGIATFETRPASASSAAGSGSLGSGEPGAGWSL